MKKYIFGIIYGFLLFGFTVYILLDTFVITRIYMEVPTDSETITETIETVSNEPPVIIQTDTSYSDGNISVSISEHRISDTTVYVADVVISSPEYLKTAFADNLYGRNVTAKTSEIASENGAILAINGDYYGSRERGYVLRGGIIYRDRASKDGEALVIYRDGSFEIVNESDTTLEELAARGAEEVLSFGPALVKDSNLSVSEDDEVGKAMTSNPRTAIGIIDELHYILVVSDGRTSESRGLSLMKLAEFMKSLGAKVAYNLDGGGSSTMYFMGRVINNPTTNGTKIKERSVSDIVYIGY